MSVLRAWFSRYAVLHRWRALLVAAAITASQPIPARAQDGYVAGVVVTRESQLPVPAATVEVVGSVHKVLTDGGGRFRLDGVVAGPVVLRIHRIGFQPLVDTIVDGLHGIHVVLAEAAVMMDAIVLTGTAGATEARTVGNALTRTAVAPILQTAPLGNVADVLQTRAPGVMIMPAQGVVGSGALVRIRGVTSLFLPNDPLVFVDGVRVDNNPRAGPYIRGGSQVSRMGDISPEEIEDVEIIKGPAAGTLFGTEASRGVIQILTKRGVQGPPRFTLSARHGANWFRDPEGRINWWFFKNSSGQLDSINPYQREEAAGRPIFRTGQPQAYNLTMSGGTPTIRYFTSAGFDRDEGILSYDWRNRFSTRVNLTVLPSDKLDIETSVGFVRNRLRLSQMTSVGAEIGWDAWTQMNFGTALTVDSSLRGFFRATPEAIATINVGSATDRLIGSLQFRHRPWSWFSQKLTLGNDVGNETSSTLFPSVPAGASGPFGPLSEGDRTVDRRRVGLSSFDYVATATATPGRQLKFSSSAGTQYYVKSIQTAEEYGHGFPVGVEVVSGAAVTSSAEDRLENKGGGVFAQEQIGWKNRRFLTGALRVDNNSAFGSHFQFVVYPKVSGSWVLNEEPFWPTGLVDEFKLRGAWGRAGRQPDIFSAERSYQPVTGPGGVSALTPFNVGNPDLKPERGEELELGFDAGLLRNRISLSFTAYRQLVADAIVPKVIGPSAGFAGTQLVNLARVRNQGIEASFDVRMLERRALTWELGASFSTNHSRILSLGGLDPISMVQAGGNANFQANQWHVEGYPVGAYFSLLIVSASLDTATGKVTNIMCATGLKPGAATAACNADDPSQRLYAGNPTPSWDGSLRSTLTLFRNLKLGALVDARGGNTLLYGSAATAHRNQFSSKAANLRNDPIFLAYTTLAQTQGAGGGRQLLMRGGFAKVRELFLSYTLPPSWAARIHASSATLTMAGRNLAILWQEQKDAYGFKLQDPELRNGSDLSGDVLNLAPPFTQFVTALRVTF